MKLKVTNNFKRNIKKYRYRQEIINRLEKIIQKLLNGEKLPESCRDHLLYGNFAGMRECHIKPDILLIYSIHETKDILYLEGIGSHSDLFI